MTGEIMELHGAENGRSPRAKPVATFKTDSEGRFEMSSVTPNQEYRIWLKVPRPKGVMKRIYFFVRLDKPGQVLDLKDVLVAPN